MTEQKIENPADLRLFRTELPNLYDDAGLSPHEFRLLAHYVRVGNCFQSVRTTAEITKMSAGMVVKARNGLEKAGFITTSPNEDYSTLNVTVVDKWEENFATYSKRSSGEQGVHVVNAGVHGVNRGVHQVKQRSNPIKKEPIKKKAKDEPASPPAPPPPADGGDVIDELAPATPQSLRMFEVINRDREAKKQGPMKRFGSVQQREQTEIALFQIAEVGELETAFNWAMVNGRHSRDAFCSAMTKWAQNLGKAPPSKNGYHKQTVFERNLAGLAELARQEGLNEP